jgi:LPXTG-motif cell wall-anchored protein
VTPRRTAAFAIGAAITAASVLVISSPALAATPGVTYVTAGDIVQTNVAGDAGWTKFPGSTFSSSTSGLAMPNGRIVSYGVATPIPTSTGTALVDFAGSTTYSASSGLDLFPGITLFDTNGVDDLIFGFDGAASLSDPTSQWYATNPIGALSGPFTLAELDTELATNATLAGWTIQSFTLEPATAVSLYTTTVNGEIFSFLPQPVVSAAPTTIEQEVLAATGVIVTTTGFLPNEAVESSLDGSSTITAGQANASGAFSFTGTFAASAGSHTLLLRGTTSAVAQSFTFAVTAAPVVAPVLAATGSGTGTPAGLAVGGALLLAGAALLLVGRRRLSAL